MEAVLGQRFQQGGLPLGLLEESQNHAEVVDGPARLGGEQVLCIVRMEDETSHDTLFGIGGQRLRMAVVA